MYGAIGSDWELHLPTSRKMAGGQRTVSRITEAATADHRAAITFVGIGNETSIRGCRAAGFEIYTHRLEK